MMINRKIARRMVIGFAMLKVTLIVVVAALAVACTHQETIEVPVRAEVICGQTPKTDRIHMQVVEPQVIESKSGFMWIGMSAKHYENLAVNFAEIKSHIGQRKAVNKFYKDCIKRHNNE